MNYLKLSLSFEVNFEENVRELERIIIFLRELTNSESFRELFRVSSAKRK